MGSATQIPIPLCPRQGLCITGQQPQERKLGKTALHLASHTVKEADRTEQPNNGESRDVLTSIIRNGLEEEEDNISCVINSQSKSDDPDSERSGRTQFDPSVP